VILKDGVKVLLDASVDYETLSKTEKIILDAPQVVEIKSLTGRNSGRFKFIESNIIIKTHNLDKAHIIADKIEEPAYVFTDANVEVVLTEEEKPVLALEKLGLNYNAN
jgi:divalent metal cation (Fe/Co/Zn/Cd) transporter